VNEREVRERPDAGHEAEGGPSILAVKLADLGDGLLAVPALAYLRAALPPGGRLEVLSGRAAAPAFAQAGLVDAVHVLPSGTVARQGLLSLLRRRRFDALVYLHSLVTPRGALKHRALASLIAAPLRVGLRHPSAWRSSFLSHGPADRGYGAWHVVESFEAVAAAAVAALGLRAPMPWGLAERGLRFAPGPGAEAAAAKLWAAWPQRRGWVALHPGGGAYSLARRWPAASFARLAEALAARGLGVALVGRRGDGTAAVAAACRAPLLDLTDACDLPTLAALLPRFMRLVSNDSGVLHLAVAMGLPVTGIYGPTCERSWGPWDPSPDGAGGHRAVTIPDLPCRPCLYRGHALGDPRGCPTRDCLAWLTPERVLAAMPGL